MTSSSVIRYSPTAFRLVLLVVLGILMTRMAWIGDDAMVTLRSALNLTSGNGAGFNATEAVQGYTHPMWFVLWALVGGLTGQWIAGVLAMGIVLSLLSAAALFWMARSPARIIVCAGLLVFSNAFMEYTTSGLETPLAYAGIGALFYLTVTDRRSLRWAALVGLAAALVILTRLDLLLLISPILVLLVVRWRTTPRLLGAAAGAMLTPLVAWFAWSHVTYWAWLPATYAAKRNVDIPARELIDQGATYLTFSIAQDPTSLLAILMGVALAIVGGTTMHRAWAAGVVAYLGYVVWIGGDFMVGRFLAVPVYVGVALIATTPLPNMIRQAWVSRRGVALASLLGLAVWLFALVGTSRTPSAVANPQEERWVLNYPPAAGIADERGFYVGAGFSLSCYWRGDGCPAGDSILRVLQDSTNRYGPRPGGTTPTDVVVGCSGLWSSVASGPGTHHIVTCGLTDRFLAELPFGPTQGWRVGHYDRPVPRGYVLAIRSGDPRWVVDPGERARLAALWSHIR